MEFRSIAPSIDHCLEEGIHAGVFPGAALLVSLRGEILHHRAYGLASRLPTERPMAVDTLFDVASLTKVMATTAAVMLLVDAGRLSLEDRVSEYIPDIRGGGRDRMSVADLLVHGAGYPAWRPFYKELLERQGAGGPPPGSPEAREWVLSEVRACPLAQKVGEGALYSDVGFILLTDLLERVTGERLDRYCAAHIFRHLDLRQTFFIPVQGRPRLGLPPERFAATEFNPWLERYLVGEVHDDNTHAMGGVSGQAGLFSNLLDIHTFALTLLKAFHGEKGLIFSPNVVQEFWRRRVFPNGSVRAYGWDVPTAGASQSGKYFSQLSFGHLGFTGCSLWIDAARELIVVLLTNRVHLGRDNQRIRQLRPALHDLILEKLEAERLSPPGVRVRVDLADDGGAEGLSLGNDMGDGPAHAIPAGTGQRRASPAWMHITHSENRPGGVLPEPPREPLQAIWFKCSNCRAILYRPDLEKHLNVCPQCQYHHYLPCVSRALLYADEGTWEELDLGVSPLDPLNFKDSAKTYRERLVVTQKKLGIKDAFRSGRCKIAGLPAHVGVFDFSFMGGSMGSVVGEKITRVFERALSERTGALVVSASGGARMQEGALSLMQMAKSCAALARLKEAGLPYFSIMCHPTTGGVAASFSMLGDVNIAEPLALIGFAGPRVIEQTIRQKLPEGFQRAEYLLEHGMVDMIVPRKEQRALLQRLYRMLMEEKA